MNPSQSIPPMNTPLEERRCENCRYLNLMKVECRRNAPQPSSERHIAAWWPVVSIYDWCGEWLQQANADAPHVIDPEREKAALEVMQAAGFAPRWSEFERCAASIDAQQAATAAQPNHPETPDSSLVEQVADAIHRNCNEFGHGFREEARAAIRAVAAWLQKRYGRRLATIDLELEAER